MSSGEKAYVLDTNVLLADPQAIYAFPDGCVVIPETVFSEVDKLKTTRADQDLRYRGREVSREIFALSEQGSLTEGVTLKNGGSLMVARLDPGESLPPEHNPRNSDDRILAVAYQLVAAGRDATLVTNDLNMLLKAQSVLLPVQRYGEESERPLLTRVTRGLWQRNRIPVLTAVAVVLAFLAVLLVLKVTGQVGGSATTATLPPEFERLIAPTQKELLQSLQRLQEDPNDLAALIALGNFYYDEGVRGRAPDYLQKATTYYERALKVGPRDPAVGTDLAVTYFYLGQIPKAISRMKKVVELSPGYAMAYFNYAVILQNGKKDLGAAAKQYRKFLKLVPANHQLAAAARARLTAIEASRSAEPATSTGL